MPVTHDRIASMFEPVSGIALRHWLKLHDYYHSAGSNEELYTRLASYVRTGFNSILRCDAPSPDADVRDDPAHRGAARADEKNWAQEELKGYLVKDPDKSAYRDVWMGILPRGEIWFRRDCLEEEVDYAISRIKQARRQIPARPY